MTFTHALATNNYGPAKFIVDASAANGTHTTIAAAITASSSGDTIFIRQGTYTENLTLKAGVNLTAFPPTAAFNATTPGKVIINGKCTFTAAGTVGIYGVVLQTNSDFALEVTGSSASIVILQDCFLNCVNNTGINFTSSSSSSRIQMEYCEGDLLTTGIALFAHSGAGNIRFLHSSFSNTGASVTANTVSGTGNFLPNYSSWANGISLSSSSSMVGDQLNMAMGSNQVAITTANTATVNVIHATIASGTSSAISVGAGTTVQLHHCLLSSSNASTVTGSGTLQFTNITFNSVASLAGTLTLSNAAMNSFISGAGVGTSGQVLTSNGVSNPPTWQSAGGGTFVKQVRASTNTAGSTTTAIPFDDSIPQNTEGAQILTASITPANANNILVIEYNFHMTAAATAGVAQQFSSALFQDSTANAIYAQLDLQLAGSIVSGNSGVHVYGRYYMTAGTTSSTTFNVRVGPGANTYTYYWLSNVGAAIFSTVNLAEITVSEYTS